MWGNTYINYFEFAFVQKPGTKKQMLHDVTYMQNLEKKNAQGQKVELWLPRAWEEERMVKRSEMSMLIKEYKFQLHRSNKL
jgi:hypothetical protein